MFRKISRTRLSGSLLNQVSIVAELKNAPFARRCRGSPRAFEALALGARAVLIGRPHLWGVACGGEDGVLWVLELFRREIDRALALRGWDGVAKLDPSIFFAADSAAQGKSGARGV
jgi:hypothetical protein